MNAKFLVDRNVLVPLIEEQFAQGTDATIIVTGASMTPLFRHGQDRAVLSPCDPTTLKRGDVPFYHRDNGQYVLHRIIGQDKDGFHLLGDGQTVVEYGVKPEQIVGVMTGLYRGERYVACTAFRYRLYTWFWMNTKWARRYLLALHRRCTREKAKD